MLNIFFNENSNDCVSSNVFFFLSLARISDTSLEHWPLIPKCPRLKCSMLISERDAIFHLEDLLHIFLLWISSCNTMGQIYRRGKRLFYFDLKCLMSQEVEDWIWKGNKQNLLINHFLCFQQDGTEEWTATWGDHWLVGGKLVCVCVLYTLYVYIVDTLVSVDIF